MLRGPVDLVFKHSKTQVVFSSCGQVCVDHGWGQLQNNYNYLVIESYLNI